MIVRADELSLQPNRLSGPLAATPFVLAVFFECLLAEVVGNCGLGTIGTSWQWQIEHIVLFLSGKVTVRQLVFLNRVTKKGIENVHGNDVTQAKQPTGFSK